MDKKKVLIAGDIMLDAYHFGKVDRISPEAPVPVFLETGDHRYVPGGAANVAVNIAAITDGVELFSVVGNDKNANVLLGLLKDAGVSPEYVATIDDRSTTSKLRFIGPNNQQILRVDDEVSDEVDTVEVRLKLDQIAENIGEFGLIVISDYNKGLLSYETTRALIELGRKNDVPVLIDVKSNDNNKYANATLLKPNRKELRELSGMKVDSIDEAIAAATELCEKVSCKYVLTTLGADGMILVDKNGFISSVKSTVSEVYDVTGAGDTSLAYLASGLLQGKDIIEAMVYANYAAGVQVSKVGTSVVYPEEVEEAIRRDGGASDSKILAGFTVDDIAPIKRKHNAGGKIVFTNGCFDILHLGHITYLRNARQLGDALVVGVNSDASVKRLKGESRPVNFLAERMEMLAALDFVDFVIPFEQDTPKELIEAVMPDVLVKGGDYSVENIVGAEEVIRNGGRVEVIPFVEGHSTSSIIKRLQEG